MGELSSRCFPLKKFKHFLKAFFQLFIWVKMAIGKLHFKLLSDFTVCSCAVNGSHFFVGGFFPLGPDAFSLRSALLFLSFLSMNIASERPMFYNSHLNAVADRWLEHFQPIVSRIFSYCAVACIRMQILFKFKFFFFLKFEIFYSNLNFRVNKFL